MNRDRYTDRRTVLKATGGLLSIAGLSEMAAANGTEDKNYGNGNGISAFLNEEAAFKEHPIWDGEMTDMRGEEVIDVAVGAMTSVDSPPGEPDELPVAFAPQVVKVSPGTVVRWTWIGNPFDFPIPHDVVSLVDADGEPILDGEENENHELVLDGDPLFQSERKGFLDEDPTFEYTFNDRGNHLYYCSPHGAPFEIHGFYNLVGMRGAVKVAGEPL